MAGLNLDAEWLEADGRGGFASGTVSGLRTRRYHALLLTATHPPAGRMVLANGIEAWAEGDNGTVPLTSQRYAPGLVHHDARPLSLLLDRENGFRGWPGAWPVAGSQECFQVRENCR